ncbi:hypothetical protein JNN96_26175 [Mycobacterium sp. DSM 3803]|nr:hypothetical protein [Mycobacterium sp. DSM 3803]
MNHPYSQGFGAQPVFPQQPAGHPPVLTSQLGHPAPPPTQPATPEPPSDGATAKTAATLSALWGVVVLGFMLFGVVDTLLNRRYALDFGFVIFMLVLCAYGLLLLGGAAMLFKRKRAGRWMVMIGFTLAIVIATVGVAATYTDATRDGRPIPFMAWILVLMLTLATVVLTALPATGRWIRSKPSPIAPQANPPQFGYPPQYPGYPPHYGA